MNRFRCLLALLTCLVLVAFAQAQDMPEKGTTHITLGQSVVPLYGPWKFTVGDSPVDSATHLPVWAEPGFNDSAWETVDLTPAKGAVDPISGQTAYVPGWTARGHAGHWGYGWYRIRVQVQGRPDE